MLFFSFNLSPLICTRRQSRGRHLNHGYHILIQSQLPIFNNFPHFLHIDDLFPCFWKFSGFGLVSMLDDGEPRMNTLLTVETFRFRDGNSYIFNQGGKTKILSHLPKLFSKNPFLCFTVSWARKAVVVYMVKLSVNETKWNISLLARTRDFILFISIWMFEKLSGFWRNWPLTTSCCYIFCAKWPHIHETAKKFAWAK